MPPIWSCAIQLFIMAWAKKEYCTFSICFFLQNLVIFQTLIAAEPQFPCFFIFGDSFVDNGNNNYLQTALKVDYLPYGIDFPSGPTGRFTNGRNIADIIGTHFTLSYKFFESTCMRPSHMRYLIPVVLMP